MRRWGTKADVCGKKIIKTCQATNLRERDFIVEDYDYNL